MGKGTVDVAERLPVLLRKAEQERDAARARLEQAEGERDEALNKEETPNG